MDLRALRVALQDAASALPAAGALRGAEAKKTCERLTDRLRRDLLPRLAAEAPILITAIAGPNNVGKSSLFNALVRAPLSPARAEGGLTKQCLAAAHPSLWQGELRAFVERRYEVVPLPEGEPPPVDQPGPPGRLHLALLPQVPQGLLLLDTPDFDSVYQRNRQASEALLVTVDLVVFVVSRHTYQNAALVQFLREVIGRGRPYLLVYNEAPRADVASEHLRKLAADVGQAPLARFHAPHQPAVETGAALLRTEPLDGGPPLPSLLSEPEDAARLKARALAASLEDAGAELLQVADAVKADALEPGRLRARLRHELDMVGQRAALKGVPADVLVTAFRDELDARSVVHRFIRMPFRALATALGFVGRKVRDALAGTPPQPLEEVWQQSERALRDGVREVAEALALEVPAFRGDEAVRALLERSLGPRLFDALDGPLQIAEVREQREDRTRLYDFCRQLVAAELDAGKEQEAALQALATLVYSLPAGAAAVATVATGGLGHDAAVWAGTALSAPLLERFVDLLGSTVRQRVSQ
ncbi:MAG TPA: GTPase, partial [Myxococcales bacterium]|nr:GTPase [Myxococcales bacterium]